MGDDMNEVEDITSISSALVLNIGTLNKRTIQSMIKAGKKANMLGIPVIFDPLEPVLLSAEMRQLKESWKRLRSQSLEETCQK